MSHFSNETIEILKMSGWNKNRSIDISGIREMYDKTNQTYSDTVLTFLREFGKLDIKYSSKAPSGFIRCLSFDPVENEEMFALDVLEALKIRWIGKPLCLIGNDQGTMLIMTPDGEVYTAFDKYIHKRGDSGEEAIENIISRTLGIPIQRIDK